MSKRLNDPQQLLNQQEIVIPKSLLPPDIQLLINRINRRRVARALDEAIAVTGIGTMVASFFEKTHLGYGIAFTTGGVTLRLLDAKKIQESHSNLQERSKNGIIHTDIEKQFPKGWINPSEIVKTHPIFYVKGNGDFVLAKVNRREYFRYLFQHKWAKGAGGKFGFNMWRWRGYLEPPKAPESVKKWAREKLAKVMEKMKPRTRPVPRPAMVRVRGARLPHSRPASQRQRIR